VEQRYSAAWKGAFGVRLDWVFRKDSDKQFHRVEVHTAGQAADQIQQIQDGVKSGDQVVAKALEFSTSLADQGK